MKFADFKIGESFWLCGNVEWRCVDIATKHILAIEITDKIRGDKTWLNGPPYAVEVVAFDADDFPACRRSKEATKEKAHG